MAVETVGRMVDEKVDHLADVTVGRLVNAKVAWLADL